LPYLAFLRILNPSPDHNRP